MAAYGLLRLPDAFEMHPYPLGSLRYLRGVLEVFLEGFLSGLDDFTGSAIGKPQNRHTEALSDIW